MRYYVEYSNDGKITKSTVKVNTFRTICFCEKVGLIKINKIQEIE